MRKIHVAYMVLLLLVFIPPQTSTIAQGEEPPPPYLYYYSRLIHAFVIERADGSDSRMLAHNVLPPDHNRIAEPRWSPSGSWMAWKSAKDYGPGRISYSGWIISTDGSQRLTMLDHPADMRVNVSMMEWAPDADLLFVAEITADENGQNAEYHYYLIDATTQSTLARYDLPMESFFHDEPTRFFWMPEQAGLTFLVTTNYEAEELVLQVVTLSADGIVETSNHPASYLPGWSDNGYLAYFSPDETSIIVYDVFEETLQSYPITGSRVDYYIDWNPQQDVALLYRSGDEDFDLWLLDLAAGKLSPLTSGIGSLSRSPDNWSSDGSKSYLFIDGALWLFNLTEQSLVELQNVPGSLDVKWAENSQQLLLDDAHGTYVYDVMSQQSTYVKQLMIPGFELVYPSPSGRYAGLYDSLSIIDFIDGQTLEFSRHSAAAYTAAYVYYYDWYDIEPSVIAAADVTHADCCGPGAFSVLSPDRSSRELTVMHGYGAGWVPERAIVHLAAGQHDSVIQQPDVTVRTGYQVTGLAWSPGSDAIVAYGDTGTARIFDVHPYTGTYSLREPFQARLYCSNLPLTCPVYWDGNVITIGDRAWNRETKTYSEPSDEYHVGCGERRCARNFPDSVSADGNWQASFTDFPTLEVNNVESGNILQTFDPVIAMEWAKNKLVMLESWGAAIFDPAENEITRLPNYRGETGASSFYNMRVSPYGDFVAAGSVYIPTHIWRIDTGELVAVLNWYGFAIEFSPDGRWFATGNSDVVTIWDVADWLD